MTDASAKEFLEFWGEASDKGFVSHKAAKVLITGCRRVLEAQENWETLNIRTLDVDACVSRFTQLRAGNFAPSSLNTYGSRFRRAVKLFRSHMYSPGSQKYPSPTSSRVKTREKKDAGERPDKNELLDTASAIQQNSVCREYKYPIRPGEDVLATLVVPKDVTLAEIGRLAAWAHTLAIDFVPSS